MKKSKFQCFFIILILLIANLSVSIAYDFSYDLQYDSNGNLIKDNNYYFEYNSFNQLVRIRQGNSTGTVLEE